MKLAEWKIKDRALSARAESYSIAWDPRVQGTRSVGRNAAKRARKALYFGARWINPRAMVARPTKPVAPAENRRRRAMTAKARALRAAKALTPLGQIHGRTEALCQLRALLRMA